jgi:hypothetical protein
MEVFDKFLGPCIPPEIHGLIGMPRKFQKEFREFLMDHYYLLMDNRSQSTWKIRNWHLHDSVWQGWQNTCFAPPE